MKINVWNSYKDQYEVTKLENARILQSWFHTNNKTYIDGGAIYTGSITAVQIASKTIKAGNIEAGTITANEIASRTIIADRIKANSITAGEILARTITANEIKAGTLTANEILAGSITGDRLKANTITATQIASNTLTATEIAIGDFTNMSSISEDRPELGIPIVTVNSKKYLKFGPAAYAQAAFAKSMTREFKVGDKYFLSFYGYKDAAFNANFIVRYFYTDKTWMNAGTAAVTMNTADGLVETVLTITTEANPALTVDNVLFFVEKDSSTTGYYYMRSIELRKMYAGKLIVDGTITGKEIAANAVTANHIVAGTITAKEIAGTTITADKLASKTITAEQIAANAITSDKIYANAVTTVKIAAEAVTATEIKTNTITASQIAGKTITAAQIASGTITANEISANAITAVKLNVTDIFADSVFVNKIKAIDLVADRITTGTLNANLIKVGALNGDRITVGTLDAKAIKTGTLSFDQARGGTLRLGEDGGGDLVVYDGRDSDGNLIPVGAISKKSAEFPIMTSPDIRGNVVNTVTRDTTLYVDNVSGNDNNNGLTRSTAFRTVQAAVNSLPKYIANNVEILMTSSGADQVENVAIKGFVGGAQLTLRSESGIKTLVGNVTVFGCSVFTRIVDFKINSRNESAVYVDKCVSVVLASLEINGNNVANQGINIFNSRAEVINCAVYNVTNDCIKAALAAHVYVGDCKGGGANARYGLTCIGAVMTGYGSAPTGSEGNWLRTYGGFLQEGSWWWNSGSAPPPIPPVTEKTVFIDSVGAGSWRNNGNPRGWYSFVDAVQGMWDSVGPSYGIWWFGDRLEFLKGKTIIGMWVSVQRNAGGWSAADGCCIRTHSYRNQPGDSQPWMSGEYVRTPAMNKGDRIWVDVTALGKKLTDPNGNDRGGFGVQADGNGNTPFLRMDAWMQVKVTYK